MGQIDTLPAWADDLSVDVDILDEDHQAFFRLAALMLAADNYLGRLSDNYDGRYDCPLGPDVRRGGAPTGDRPQRAAA